MRTRTVFGRRRGKRRIYGYLLICLASPLLFSIGSCSSKEQIAPPEVIPPPWYGETDFFVSTNDGTTGNSGTIDEPCKTIQEAIDSAAVAGGGSVHIAEGVYQENIVLKPKVSLYGGYENTSFDRDPDTHVTTIVGGPTAVYGGGADSLTVDGLSVSSTDIDVGQSVTSAIAIQLHDCSGAVLSGNLITSGSVLVKQNGVVGAPGDPGERGSNGSSNGTPGGGGVGHGGCNGGIGGVGRDGGSGGGARGGCTNGGAGGAGGIGGLGGVGGDPPGIAGSGGGGGIGSAGGAGGHGGAGPGGHAIGVLIGPNVTIVQTGNTIEHGSAGIGGTSGGGVKADDGVAAPTITRVGGGR